MSGRDLLRLKRAGPLAHLYVAGLSRDSQFIRGATSVSIAILLAGCATVQPVPEKVFIRVPAPCIEASQLPAPPVAKSDADLAKLPDFDLVITLATDRLEYRRYSNEAAAVLTACVK